MTLCTQFRVCGWHFTGIDIDIEAVFRGAIGKFMGVNDPCQISDGINHLPHTNPSCVYKLAEAYTIFFLSPAVGFSDYSHYYLKFGMANRWHYLVEDYIRDLATIGDKLRVWHCGSGYRFGVGGRTLIRSPHGRGFFILLFPSAPTILHEAVDRETVAVHPQEIGGDLPNRGQDAAILFCRAHEATLALTPKALQLLLTQEFHRPLSSQ